MRRDWGGVALPPPPLIATKAELLQHLKERPSPTPRQHLTPDGTITDDVNNRINAAAEKRIDYLKSRLDDAHGRLKTGLTSCRDDRGMKADFERSR